MFSFNAKEKFSLRRRQEYDAWSAMIHFCPSCWVEIRENVSVCPRCRYDLARYNQLPYEDKLILALQHPVKENRMLAIQLLGDLHSKSAIPVFRSILREGDDFYVIREIVRSLHKIGGSESDDLLRTIRKHKSRLVRDLFCGQ
jgi:hypothetical protein